MRMSRPFAFVFLFSFTAAWTGDPDAWPSSPLSREGLDSGRLAQLDAHIRAKLPHVRSLLVARHGRLVFERYYGDASQDGLHNVQSMTKSVSSALVGIALKQGLIPSLENRVLD
jgi:CubicO group peptidase (beta-lactamase class C family)